MAEKDKEKIPNARVSFELDESHRLRADVFKDNSVDVESLVEDARWQFKALKSQHQDAKRSLLIWAAIVVVIAGFAGRALGRSSAWDLAEIRAQRVWAHGFCDGVGDGIVYMSADLLGDDPTVIYGDLHVEGWSSLVDRLGSEGGVATSAQFSLYSLPERTVAEQAQHFVELPVVAEDPILEDDPDLQPPVVRPAQEERYYDLVCDDNIELSPDRIRDGYDI